MNEEYLKQNTAPGTEIRCLGVTDSTSLRARELYEGRPLLVTAQGQTAGRGRRGRDFYSPTGTGLYMSVAFPVDEQNLVFLTCAAAEAVCRALQQTAGISPQIKWVNDIMLGEKKIAGILCERIPEGVIIGVGINLTTSSFPPELGGRAGSIGTPVNEEALCAAAANGLFALADGAGDYLQEYRSRLMLCGREIEFEQNGRVRRGTVTGVDDNGGLLVNTAEGPVTLNSGEITVRALNPQ